MPRRRIPVPALQHETAWQYGSPSSSPPGGSACRMSVGVGGDQQGAVYIHVHTHVCLCVAVCAHIQIHAYVCEHVCTQGFVGCTCVSAHMGTYMFVCAPMHTCTQMCVCVHMYVWELCPLGVNRHFFSIFWLCGSPWKGNSYKPPAQLSWKLLWLWAAGPPHTSHRHKEGVWPELTLLRSGRLRVPCLSPRHLPNSPTECPVPPRGGCTLSLSPQNEVTRRGSTSGVDLASQPSDGRSLFSLLQVLGCCYI